MCGVWLKHGGVGERGATAPGPHPAAWLNAGRKEVKAAASGRRNEIFHLAQCSSPLCLSAPLSQLVLQSTAAAVLATCTAAMGTAWPAQAPNLNLVAGYATYWVSGLGGKNHVRPPVCLGCSLLQASSPHSASGGGVTRYPRLIMWFLGS